MFGEFVVDSLERLRNAVECQSLFLSVSNLTSFLRLSSTSVEPWFDMGSTNLFLFSSLNINRVGAG